MYLILKKKVHYRSLSLLRYLKIRNAAYYDTTVDQYPNYYTVLEMYTGYFDSLDIDTFFLSQQYRNNERLLYFQYSHTVVLCLKFSY